MVNLFGRAAVESGGLTAGFLALLEHADPAVLTGLLQKAGITTTGGGGGSAAFPAPGGPPGAGVITLPGLRLVVAAEAPGQPFDPAALQEAADEVLAVTVSGREVPGIHVLSWETVDRFLLEMAERFDPETRSGFLIRQFRALLAELGLEHFAGFKDEELEEVPGALNLLNRFQHTANRFFRHLTPALAALWDGVSPVRQSGPTELLAGYLYQDYAGENFGTGNFLRIAFHLIQGQIQLSFWITPAAAESHSRLREAITEGSPLLEQLQALDAEPLLWLWSAAGERQIALDRMTPDLAAELDWNGHQAGVQRHQPLSLLAGEGAAARIASLAEELVQALQPVLMPVLH